MLCHYKGKTKSVREYGSHACKAENLWRIPEKLAWVVSRHKRDLLGGGPKILIGSGFRKLCLQQTRVAAVIPFTSDFLCAFRTFGRWLRGAGRGVALWRGSAITAAQRNLQYAAQEIVASMEIFPRDEKDALATSRIGRYTAAAILRHRLRAKHAVLDGKCCSRFGANIAVQGDLRDAKRWQSLQRSADALLDSSAPSDWNQAVMELGATLCTPQSPAMFAVAR